MLRLGIISQHSIRRIKENEGLERVKIQSGVNFSGKMFNFGQRLYKTLHLTDIKILELNQAGTRPWFTCSFAQVSEGRNNKEPFDLAESQLKRNYPVNLKLCGYVMVWSSRCDGKAG